ncbi:MAG TPA: ABC transporter permease, partial [Gemmatimonadales bacterium]
MVTGLRPLHRKVVRDLWHLRSQMLAVAVVMACGISMFVALRSMHRWLREAQADYYASYRFADVFAHVRRAPATLAAEIARLPGVTGVRVRVVADVTLDVPGLDEPASGRLISIPEQRSPILNDLHLRRGRWITGAAGEVIVSQAFAQANGLELGDRLPAVLNGRWQRLRIVGLAQSPEYIYEIRGLGDIFPDARRFGVLWMGERAMDAAYRMEGAFNDLSLTLGADAVSRDVIAALDRRLAPFGSAGAYPRADQLSHQFVSSEIEETRVTSVLLPSIFLAVTAFLLHMVLARLVATQRDQIAVLKAFGYGNGTIALHYFQLALGPILLGTAAGVALGLWFAGGLAGVYARFYQFPAAVFRPDWGVVGASFGVSAGAALIGAISSVARAVRLPPAEAMRPEAPATFRPGPVERLGLERLASPASRMILRNVERRPLKATLSALGIALATATVVTGWWMFDAVDVLK